jgi:PTS system ascorbate-specific IIB component
MKIITVCTMGIGTSILLKMNVEAALERLGVSGSVEASDLGSARGAAQSADIIMTNAEMARVLGDLASPVAVIANFMDTDEIMRAVRAVMEKP